MFVAFCLLCVFIVVTFVRIVFFTLRLFTESLG